MNEAVGFDELLWLLELSRRKQKKPVPDLIGARLVTRGLIERTAAGFALTTRGRIALTKLG